MSLLICLGLAFLPPESLVLAGVVRHPEAAELSGLVASRRHEGVFWTHPDSGHAPLLFAVKADGTVLGRFSVDARNLDWEDIATDDAGHLLVGDIGNNTRLLPIRTLYVLDEPDPVQPHPDPLPVVYSITYRYEPGAAFDAEALVVAKNELILISKTATSRQAHIYAIPFRKPTSRLPVLPTRTGILPGFPEPVTGADLSADGRYLAVCALDVVRVYERAVGRNWRLVRSIRYQARGIEGVCWAGKGLLLGEESGRLWRLPFSEIAEPGTRP